MTSQNFSSKCGSVDSLNVRVTCGLMSFARHNRRTVSFDTPVARAMPRTDQRVRPAGGWVAPRMIRSRTSGPMLGLRPRPPASASPAIPAARKRRSHLMTTGRLTPSARAVAAWLTPSARLSTIAARWCSRCAAVGRCVTASSASRCCGVMLNVGVGRGMPASMTEPTRYVNLF